MVFREQVFRHIAQDWNDVIQRAGTLWSPRWRDTHGLHHTLSATDAAIPSEPPSIAMAQSVASPSTASLSSPVTNESRFPRGDSHGKK